MTGTIKKVIKQKGFGFITPDDGTEEVFFHRGSLAPRTQIEDFNEGDTVQFHTRKGDKGPVAFNLKIRGKILVGSRCAPVRQCSGKPLCVRPLFATGLSCPPSVTSFYCWT